MTTDNIATIRNALALLIETGDVDALEPLLSNDFIHHRPGSNLSKTGWLSALRAVPIANLRVEVQHALAQGDYVVIHSRRWLEGGGAGIVGVDIWRLAGGKIAEGWEIIEPVADAVAHMLWWKADAQ